MKQHTIRRKTLAVIAAAAMMLANFALNGSALADTGRANPQSDVTVIAFQQSWNARRPMGLKAWATCRSARRWNPCRARNGGPSTSRSATI